MKTSLIYGFAITNIGNVEETLRDIARMVASSKIGVVEDVEAFVLDPDEYPIVWAEAPHSVFADKLIITKKYDETYHQHVLLIYPEKLKFNAEHGVQTVNTNVHRSSWGVAELFTALMGWVTLPSFHLVTF